MNKVLSSGVILIDKPAGITSHDVVDVIRKMFKGYKVGHTGTLDPIATGLLNICVGDATKLSSELTSEDKKYKVKMLLGVETDTYDITGRIMFASVVNKDEIYIKERIKRFVGRQMQMPPIYSAIKVDGKRAYEVAREGGNIELKPREIEIYSIENINVDLDNKEVEFEVSCSKGTYIRSLVNDIGKKIGCGATMTELRRLKCGNFDIKDAITLEKFIKLEIDEMNKRVITIEECYKDSKNVHLNDTELKKFLNGVNIECNSIERIVKVYNNKNFVGLGVVENNILKRYIVEE